MQEPLIGWTIAALARLPISLRVRLGRALGVVFSLLPTRERRVAEAQIRRFLPDAPSPGAVVRAVYANLGETIAESLDLEPILRRATTHISSTPLAELEEARAAGRPLMVLAAHIGNWDLLAAFFVRSGFRVVTIGRPARNPALQSALGALRARYGIETIWRTDRGASRKIIRELRAHRLIAALLDQDIETRHEFIPFFGQPAATPSGLVELGCRLRAAFFVTTLVRTGTLSYRVDLTRLDDSSSPTEILHQYHRRIEAVIREYPGQWVWIHKRWRTRPDGQRAGTAAYLEELRQPLRSSSSS